MSEGRPAEDLSGLQERLANEYGPPLLAWLQRERQELGRVVAVGLKALSLEQALAPGELELHRRVFELPIVPSLQTAMSCTTRRT